MDEKLSSYKQTNQLCLPYAKTDHESMSQDQLFYSKDLSSIPGIITGRLLQ